MIILVVGPQGSGKTTQAKLLSQELNLPFFSAGQVLRDQYEKQDPDAIRAEKYWEKGDLVPDGLMEKILLKFLRRNKEKFSRGYIVDGFPRNRSQYNWMSSVFKSSITAIIHLTLSRDQIMERLNKRRKTEHREDETAEAIKTRLRHYEEETVPLIKRLEQDGIPEIKVDGSRSIERVQEAVSRQLNSVLQSPNNINGKNYAEDK